MAQYQRAAPRLSTAGDRSHIVRPRDIETWVQRYNVSYNIAMPPRVGGVDGHRN